MPSKKVDARRVRRVGVTATSHKVIQNLFDAVGEQVVAAGEVVILGRKPGDDEEVPPDVRPFKTNEAALTAVRSGEVQVLGGTAWLWADDAAAGAVDLLFVDEAGQFSLANALAVAQAADSLVLLGDPRQLAQPQKASHPDGVEVSAFATRAHAGTLHGRRDEDSLRAAPTRGRMPCAPDFTACSPVRQEERGQQQKSAGYCHD